MESRWGCRAGGKGSDPYNRLEDGLLGIGTLQGNCLSRLGTPARGD